MKVQKHSSQHLHMLIQYIIFLLHYTIQILLDFCSPIPEEAEKRENKPFFSITFRFVFLLLFERKKKSGICMSGVCGIKPIATNVNYLRAQEIRWAP